MHSVTFLTILEMSPDNLIHSVPFLTILEMSPDKSRNQVPEGVLLAKSAISSLRDWRVCTLRPPRAASSSSRGCLEDTPTSCPPPVLTSRLRNIFFEIRKVSFHKVVISNVNKIETKANRTLDNRKILISKRNERFYYTMMRRKLRLP